MSTLAESEAGVDTLPTPPPMTLRRHLETKLRKASATAARLVLERGQPVLVAPPGAPPMTPDVVKAAPADFP